MFGPVWAWIAIAAFSAYCAGSFAQLLHHRRYSKAGDPAFPAVDVPASVIMGIRSEHPDLERFIRSVCDQDYHDFEVLLVSNVPDEPGAAVGAALASEYPHVRHVLAGPHDPAVLVGKNHALLAGIVNAAHDVLVFCDADVVFEPQWLQKMVSPLGRDVGGRTVHAVGGPIFILPRNRLGRAFALGSNVITYLASYARERQLFPAYVSGHTMAVGRDIVMTEVAPYWARAYNDDLILAYVLRARGMSLYYRRDAVLRPEEDTSSWRGLRDKMVRWAITVRRFQHPDMKRETTLGIALNAQFVVGPLLAAVLFLVGFPLLGLIALAIAWTQVVVFRYILARRIGERYGGLLLLAPAFYLFFGAFFMHHYLWGRRFHWGSSDYLVEGSFTMDSPRDDEWMARYPSRD